MALLPHALERQFGWLARLRRNRAGNTLAMMGVAIVPLAGLVGGAVDMSRMYLTKTRLQQACDAGALAGRKAMGGGVWSQDSYKPRTTANEFFDGNFREGDYGTEKLDREYTEAAGKVNGTASTDVPMTLMQIFKRGTQRLTVECDAEMRLPNTDVMFVLDTTGSMGETLTGDNKTKMAGLKIAVKCFYEIVARLNSNAACEGGNPSGGTGSEVQVRFGFVPFSTNVNVGRLLPSEWFADRATYQSRSPVNVLGRRTGGSAETDYGEWTVTETSSQGSVAACNARRPTNSTTKVVPDWPKSWQSTTWDAVVRTYWREYGVLLDKGVCYVGYRDNVTVDDASWEATTVPAGAVQFTAWRYAPTEFDISSLKNGSGWNAGLTLPVGEKATNAVVPWNGCIEERQTVSRASYAPIDSVKAQAIDLDIDRKPNGDADTMWRPALQDIIYPSRANYRNSSTWSRTPINTFTSYSRVNTDADDNGSAIATCGTSGRKMQAWPNAGVFDSYVDSLAATGNTYHDIGLLWGARLISPTGLFRSENEFTPKGGEIERHVIFMTDGDACTGTSNYQAYGFNWFDRRTIGGVNPTDGCTTTGNLTQQVNARTAALCEAVKNKNITLWVVWFGEKNAYIEGAMEQCATEGNFFVARDSKQLQAQFREIADKISQLRLTA